jgi:hypothetical protein
MKPDLDRDGLDRLRLDVRRRATANLILGLLERSRDTAGRFTVRSAGTDALLLDYRDVRTVVRHGASFGFDVRDFTILLILPDAWPFERAAAPVPFVLAPADFAHSNSDGRAFCLDMQGVTPERVPELIYDNLRLRRFRLDHCVDAAAADFVRGHLDEMPVDPRPLGGGEETR